jgi:beta-glucanase (GH16 family)
MMRSFLRSIALAGCVAAAPAYANVFTPITGDASYKLTFDEEFNGTAVNNTVWQVTYDGNSDQTYGTYPNAYFWNSTNMTVGGGSLDLAVSKVGSNYHTAAITTSFLQTYGYWEARVKMPANARGIGTNFWTDANGWNFPEIDMALQISERWHQRHGHITNGDRYRFYEMACRWDALDPCRGYMVLRWSSSIHYEHRRKLDQRHRAMDDPGGDGRGV